MRLLKISLLSYVLLLSMSPFQAHGQSGKVPEVVITEEVRKVYPDFRVIKKIENFPERSNTSVKLPIRASSGVGSNTDRALVTLHDGETGEPLESCFTPCNLHKVPDRPVFVFPYKFGHYTFPNKIEADPDKMRAKYSYWDNEYQVKIGPDYRKAFIKQKICQREFENMERVDQDAKPCYRIAPPVPNVNYSGKCKVVFDISPKGFVENVKATECSNSIFEEPSLFAVWHWTYFPKIENGSAVTQTGVKSNLQFNVTDFDGALLDENGKRVKE